MIAEVLAPKFLALYAFLASAAFVHFRGKVRHKFTRQLTDHSTLMAPINVFMYAFSSVPNEPYLDTKHFPELKVIRDNWETIRDEALALDSGGSIKAAEGYNDLGFNSFYRRGWKRFYLRWYSDDFHPSAKEKCPKTVELLKQLPTIHAAMFTMLPPGGRLVAHRDPYAGSLRYHLGLVTPNSDECRIYVDDQPYSWRDGEDVVFDETYIHWATNESDQDRIIFFADVERPMNNRFARAVNRFFRKYLVSAAKTSNEEGEKIGVLNKAFAYVYQVRLLGKRLKAYNRKLYYAQKYVLIALILAAVIWWV